ncbi:hypothetical protein ABZ923_31030 [Streptomyces sp. NPDC046881]|uniref:NACHT N-terminal helical domain 7-containing protein n=1 Tax=Streptomyces sp. NPDC046881 TaxID=3155374 RepID=UPI003407EB8F
MDDSTGSVADFCAAIRRLVRGSGVQQKELARVLHRSDATVSELLNGRRTRPPSLDEVLAIVAYCRSRAGAHAPPGLNTDPAWWRSRFAELESTLETRRDPAGARTPERRRTPEGPGQTRLSTVAFDFADAVNVLVGGRAGFENLVEELLEPLGLVGGGNADPRGLFDGFGARVRAACGTTRTALLCAADVVLLVTAFCDAVARSGWVRSTEGAGARGDARGRVLEELDRVLLGSARVRDTAERREEITAAYASAAGFVHSLADPLGQRAEQLAPLALRRYEALLAPVVWDCAELRLTSEVYDPDEEQGRPRAVPDRVGLVEFGLLLREFAGIGGASGRQRARLRAPIAPMEGPGPVIPSLEAGYVDPAFRVARHAVGWQPASDDWWAHQPVRDDLAAFLAAHVLTHQATQAPLVVLGHPGSGKSLLTQLIEARLPENEFFCLRVELRHVDAEADLQGQIEESLFAATGVRVAWPEAVEDTSHVVRVVLLDGFDELLQAGAGRLDAGRQWQYLKRVEQFQQREYDAGRPTVVIVTSRTVVADQVLMPSGGMVVRLEPFDDVRIDCWLEVWEAANRRHFAAPGVEPLTSDAIRPHRELARQPLLLLMLALYDAVGNPLQRLGGRDIGRADLYERLITEFVRREVVKQQGAAPPSIEAEAVEREAERLGLIAMGMFNRGRQSITGAEAEADLRAFLGEEGSALVFGRFFFVHEAQAVVGGEHLKSYEFMHATFGEYLVARLIGRELRRAAAGDGGSEDDGRLYALLSFVPLTDRAEIMDDLADMPRLGGAPKPAELSALARVLFGGTRLAHGPSEVPGYRPAERSRTARDAVYGANVLLLAALAEERVRASEFFGPTAPVESWWRCVQLWRSQFGQASWEAFTRSLSVAWERTEPASGREGDLCISLGTGAVAGADLSWAAPLTPGGPTAYHDPAGTDPAELLHRLALLCDGDVQQVVHAVQPLVQGLPGALRTYRVDEGGAVRSAAHVLVALLSRDTAHPEETGRRYLDALAVTQALPAAERARAADMLVRHLVHDADGLPPEVLSQVLQEVMRPSAAADGPPAQIWPVLQSYVEAQLERTDLSPERSASLTGLLLDYLRRYAALFAGNTDPAERLRHLLREAASTHVWDLAMRRSGKDAHHLLDEGLSLLGALPADRRPPDVIIGLLRLARELGRADWLGEHADPLLRMLSAAALRRLRPTDADALVEFVAHPGTLAALRAVQRMWRDPAGTGRGEDKP